MCCLGHCAKYPSESLLRVALQGLYITGLESVLNHILHVPLCFTLGLGRCGSVERKKVSNQLLVFLVPVVKLTLCLLFKYSVPGSTLAAKEKEYDFVLRQGP